MLKEGIEKSRERLAEGLGRPKKARESKRWSVKAREGHRKPEKAQREPEKAPRRPLGPSQGTVKCCKGSLTALIPSSTLLLVMLDLRHRSDNNNEI